MANTQIVPEHEYAHVMTVIHDNSALPAESATSAESTYCNMMCVFMSPKGIDNEIRTVSGGEKDFIERYGIGTFDIYGQPFLNAYAAAKTNAATLHCLRVTADDATYAVGALVAHYKVSGAPTVEPELPPVVESDKIDTMGHENVIAIDSVDEETGNITIDIAGTGVEPGISAENKALFGDVTGEYIDITVDLTKAIALVPTKTYQITQVNPALAALYGKDPDVTLANGQYTKVKAYSGADLEGGLAILVGASSTISISIVEYAAVNGGNVETLAAPVSMAPVIYTIKVTISNGTDLGVEVADPNASYSVTADGAHYTMTSTGDVVPGVIHEELFGTPDGNNVEVFLTIPGIDPAKKYRVVQENANLELYQNDASVKKVGSKWTKDKTYTGAELVDGYSVLLGEGKGDISVSVYEVDEPHPATRLQTYARSTIKNDLVFVANHDNDLGIKIGDGTPGYTVALNEDTVTWTINGTGEAVAHVINADLWGDVPSEHDVLEVLLTIPGLDTSKQYRVRQVNPALQLFPDDQYVKEETGGVWAKVRDYSGEDLKDGYGLLLSKEYVGNATVYVTEVDANVEGSDSNMWITTHTEDTFHSIKCSGTVKAGGYTVDKNVYPTATDDAVTVTVWDLPIPDKSEEAQYTMRNVNDYYEAFQSESEVNYDQTTQKWTKVRNLTGKQIAAGIMMILGNGTGSNRLEIYKADEYQDGKGTPVLVYLVENDLVFSADAETSGTVNAVKAEGTGTVIVKNGYTFVKSLTHDTIVEMGDETVPYTITGADTDSMITLSGPAVPGVLHDELWGDVSGNNLEVCIAIPGIEAEKTYQVTQYNANLALYKDDPTVSLVNGMWTKVKTYSGADIEDGYAVLIGEGKGDVAITVEEVVSYTTELVETEIATVDVINGWKFVESHIPGYEGPMDPLDPGFTGPTGDVWEPVGEPVVICINSAISFTTNSARSAYVKALAATRKIQNAAIAAAAVVIDEEVAEDPRMDIYYTFETLEGGLTTTANIGNAIKVDGTPDANGYRAVKIFEICARGKGTWGNNIRWTLESYPRGDRSVAYKNYTFSIYEIAKATLTKKEEYTIAFNPEATASTGAPLYADFVVGDPGDKSSYIEMVCNPQAFVEMYAAYQTIVPDTALTQDQFDPLLGRLYGTTTTDIDYLYIDTDATGHISMSGLSGIALGGGSDGAFDPSNPDRQAAINEAYLKAWSGEIDRGVRSKKLYPTDLILDANYSTEVKTAIHELVAERQDCVAIYDLGTDMNTFAGLLANLADFETFVITRYEAIDGYYGKIQDPLSFKIVPVTSTYALATMYPLHFAQHGAKHVPLAGSSYGVMKGFLSGTCWPVYDDDLDSKIMDTLTDNKVNFLKVNTKKQIVRGAQATRQDGTTNLSELSNVFVLNDIHRDCIQLCEQYEYNFANSTDLQRFNKAAAILAEKYRDAQVDSISAVFEMTDWESERGILHLYVDFVHKNIIKRAIVEINVNRGSVVIG